MMPDFQLGEPYPIGATVSALLPGLGVRKMVCVGHDRFVISATLTSAQLRVYRSFDLASPE